MKRNILFMIMVLLISLLAAGAYAQTGTQTQTKPEAPVQERTEDGPKGDGTATTERAQLEEQQDSKGEATGRTDADKSGEQPKDQVQTKPEDAVRTRTDEGPKGQGTATTDRTRSSFETQQDAQGDAIGRLDADKDGEQPKDQTRNYGDGDGGNRELGESHRRGDELAGETGPHGPMDHGSPVDADKSGDQTMNYGTGDGNNYELGENQRHGDEYTGETGPHGLVLDDDFIKTFGLDKIFGGNADGTFEGDMLRHSWGPGASELDGVFGPNVDGVGYGPGGPTSDEKGTSVIESRAQRGSGRR